MRLRLLLPCFFNVLVINAILAAPPAYKTTPRGVIIYTGPLVTGTSHAVKSGIITHNIIRVITAPDLKAGAVSFKIVDQLNK
jgi:alpha-D-xyloside xylohydrolase